MVLSRSDVKKRNKEVLDPLNEINPKRTKVHAQRKFAQGSGMNSPVKEMNIVKEKEKTKLDDDSSDDLPTNQPPTEDFLSFLCFRGTKYLTPRLNVFNEIPSSQRKSYGSTKYAAGTSGVQKNKASITQDYKKRLGARQTGLQKGNAVRARTASNERQALKRKALERQVRRKVAQRRVKPVRKPHPAILKRLGATRLRTGLRSGGQLPPESDVGLKTDRKPKRGRPSKQRPHVPKKSKITDSATCQKQKAGKVYESEEESHESEEDEVEEIEETERKKLVIESTRKSKRSRGTSNSPAQSPKKTRPTRKTKEAAALYMEMLTKDLRNPDEDDDDYVRSFPTLPSVMKRDIEEDSKINPSRKGRLWKSSFISSTTDKAKLKNTSKDIKELDEKPLLLKRDIRKSTQKLKNKPSLKIKRQVIQSRMLRGQRSRLKTSLRLRTRSRAKKTLSQNIIDESDSNTELEEVENEEDEEEEDDEVKIIEEPKRRATRSSDLKKPDKITLKKGNRTNIKKTKTSHRSKSLSGSEDETIVAKMKKSCTTKNVKEKKMSVEKHQEAEGDSTPCNPPKRSSLRTSKKVLSDFGKETPKFSRRSKRNKGSDEDTESKGGRLSESKRPKYNEDSDEDVGEEFIPKTRSSYTKRVSDKYDLDDENVKKVDETSKSSKTTSKKFEKGESENGIKKYKGGFEKNKLKDTDEENVHSPSRKNRKKVNTPLGSEDSSKELEGSLTKKTKCSALKGKNKNELEVSKKEVVNVERENSETNNSSKVSLRKGISTAESDDDSNVTRRSRGALQAVFEKKVQLSDSSKSANDTQADKEMKMEKTKIQGANINENEVIDVLEMSNNAAVPDHNLKSGRLNPRNKIMRRNEDPNSDLVSSDNKLHKDGEIHKKENELSVKNRPKVIKLEKGDIDSQVTMTSRKEVINDKTEVNLTIKEEKESSSSKLRNSKRGRKPKKSQSDNELEEDVFNEQSNKMTKKSAAKTKVENIGKCEHIFSENENVTYARKEEVSKLIKETAYDCESQSKSNHKVFPKKDNEIKDQTLEMNVHHKISSKTKQYYPSNTDLTSADEPNTSLKADREKYGLQEAIPNNCSVEEVSEVKPASMNDGKIVCEVGQNPKFKKNTEAKCIKKENPISYKSLKNFESKEKNEFASSSSRQLQMESGRPKIESVEIKLSEKESVSRKFRKKAVDENKDNSVIAEEKSSVCSPNVPSASETSVKLFSNSNEELAEGKESTVLSPAKEKGLNDDMIQNPLRGHNESMTHVKRKNNEKNVDDKFHLKKHSEDMKKLTKTMSDSSTSCEVEKSLILNVKKLSGNVKSSVCIKSNTLNSKKSRDSKLEVVDDSNVCSTRKQTRISVESQEKEEKRVKRPDIKEKRIDDIRKSFKEEDYERLPVKPGRKPSLTARAQFITVTDKGHITSKHPEKVPAPVKRKSLGDRDSCDTVGSGSSSIVECKVVLSDISDSLGEISELSKPKKGKKFVKTSGKDVKANENIETADLTFQEKNSDPSCDSTVRSGKLEFDKNKEKSGNVELQTSKPSIGDTWRQAFKNAKIPKPGHLSPVPHTVKPFVRQKLPNLSGSFQGKSGKVELKSGEASKVKSPQNTSPFKSLMANQTQQSLSPDLKKSSSPAHKVNFPNFESPVKRFEDIKPDFKKQEAPVKTLTQLQYEKRSSEFINSYLEPGPPSVLPAFESIRAYKKKEEIKDSSQEIVKIEPQTNPSNIPEPTVKPSPEGKHLNLPLAVEHTLRKNSPITVSKKPPLKPISFPQEKRVDSVPLPKPVVATPNIEKKCTPTAALATASAVIPNISGNPVSTPSCADLLVREPSDLNSLAKKKVNMTKEEINLWLNDSTSSGIEHKKDCGIFENNQCECSYRTCEASMQNSIGVSELVPKEEKIDHGVVEPPVQLKELDTGGKYVAETISTCKVEDYKEKLLLKTDNKMAPPRARRSSGQDRAKGCKSMTEDEMCEYDFRFDRVSNSPRESCSDVSSVTHRDDASSSSEVPERKIFHQKRTNAGSKKLSVSNPTAFSAENESSIYAFKPDPPSTVNKPFRRSRGKSNEQDEGKQPSSSSIAVQVNLNENEIGGLECSTQTERPLDDNEGHLFYIPLPDEQLQSGLPQGVAVKLDKEGPDQRVIMRAKLVTKPSNSFTNSSSNSRAFLNTVRNSHQKPEQKVRPLWSDRAPVGTVQPTMREPQTTDKVPPVSEKAPQVSQSCQSTQISEAAANESDSSHPSRTSMKAQKPSLEPKVSETLPPSSPPTAIEWKGTEFPPPDLPPTLVEAPTFYPTEKEFQDPLEYIEQLTPLAQSFGICRIVPPSSFKPECKVSDDMRFTAYNQYVHKLMERWGPNVKELCAIKKYLSTQSINLNQLPLIGSMEVDLPRLYQTVQQHGGLKEVIEKKRWAKVSDAMRIPKSAQDRLTKLDDIYCKYLLPYDTLSHAERTKLFEDVEKEWKDREKRIAAEEDDIGNNTSAEESDESSSSDDNMFECISKGKNMPLSAFFRIARNTMYMWFKESTPSPDEVEMEFWRLVSTRTCHVCVHSGSIDSGTWGYGFPTTKTSATSRHPWNLKVLTNSPGSILRSLGPLMGVTVPTLHVSMLFSSCCWYRDPHALPWIEYLHTGASKIWYGVPGSRAGELRQAMYPLLPKHTRDRKIWLPSDTMMVPPQYLLDGGVSVCRVVQEPGHFILVFPKAFTSTISTGYIVSESVYFAQPSWLNSALEVFKDIQDSCEPPVFSLHKLLFSVANDTRSSADILNQILPMLMTVIENEVKSRKELESLGLTVCEKLCSNKSGRRKKQEEEQNDNECDVCRGILFLSTVTNSNEDCSYCIDHAIEALSKDHELIKFCKLLVAYDESDFEDILEKVKSRIEVKSQKKQKEKGASSSGTRI